MSSIQAAFDKAVKESKQLPEKPDNMTLLKIYALYKQATGGDVEGKRPGFTDMVGRAKYDAWATLKGKSTDEAMQEYTDAAVGAGLIGGGIGGVALAGGSNGGTNGCHGGKPLPLNEPGGRLIESHSFESGRDA